MALASMALVALASVIIIILVLLVLLLQGFQESTYTLTYISCRSHLN